MSTRGGVQNCRTRDAAQTSHSQLNKIIDSNAGTNEQHNDIINESTNSSEQQQYVSINNSNTEESNADINISETSALDEDIGSNNRGGNETKNNTWPKDDPVIKIFPFSEIAGLKIDVPENDIVCSISNFRFQMNCWVPLFKG